MPRKLSLLIIALIACLALNKGAGAGNGKFAEQQVHIFAAASLTDALNRLARTSDTGQTPRMQLTFGSSGALARQITQRAPASIFISASSEWIDYLDQQRLLVAKSRRTIARNRLVLIAPKSHPFKFRFAGSPDLAEALIGGQLAIADPAHAPAGRYAREALVSLGIWDQLKSRTVRAQHVRGALVMVARGGATAGLVYATDAKGARNIALIDTVPQKLHSPIRYAAAIVGGADNPATRAVYDRLTGARAKSIYAALGFETE